MRILLFFVLVFSFSDASQAQNIRRLLLFATDESVPELVAQKDLLTADSAGFVERDVWIAVFPHSKEMRRLFDRYDVDNQPFMLIMLGKEEEEIIRSEKPLTTAEIFKAIDEFPQRQVEIRGN